MTLVNTILLKLRQKGIGPFLQFCFCKLLGIDNQREEIDALYYVINHYLDITQLPPTEDKGLRDMQCCDAAMMNVIDKFCKQHGITYWLDFGTLLGAIRHKGFIPWDDDMDISMPRKDYEQFKALAPEILGKYGFTIEEAFGRIGIGYRHEETGIWCDIFPAYEIRSDKTLPEIYQDVKRQKDAFHTAFCKSKDKDEQVISPIREKFFVNYREGSNVFYILEMEFLRKHCYVQSENSIYDLSVAKFEDYEFNIPRDYDSYLRVIYGDYMSFPHGGVLHHGDAMGRPPLGDWAKLHGVDMEKVKMELEKIANDFF